LPAWLAAPAFADYKHEPAGSMHPNILEGVVVLVNRLAYDLKLPLSDIVLARLEIRGDVPSVHVRVAEGRRALKSKARVSACRVTISR